MLGLGGVGGLGCVFACVWEGGWGRFDSRLPDVHLGHYLFRGTVLCDMTYAQYDWARRCGKLGYFAIPQDYISGRRRLLPPYHRGDFSRYAGKAARRGCADAAP